MDMLLGPALPGLLIAAFLMAVSIVAGIVQLVRKRTNP